jgi:hypothetical protein
MMIHAPKGNRRFALATLALVFALGACHDDAMAPARGAPPVDQLTDLGTYIVDVNVKTGAIVTHAAQTGASASSSVDARFFGAPGTISHTFRLRGGAPTAGNTFTLDDHIENMFSFPIGTHVQHTTGAFPQDTMGVYVYMAILPVVTAGCTPSATCKVAADSGYDGAFTFTSATPQPYMFFKTILEAADGTPHSGLDFTDQSTIGGIDYFRSFSFRASSGVTNFKFGVSVRAAVVRPNESRWLVTYVGDSFPNRLGTSLADLRSEADWRVHGSAASVTDTSTVTTGCAAGASRCFRIVSATPGGAVPADSITYFRSDSVGTSDSAYIAATVAVSNLRPNTPSVYMGMQDRVKLIQVGIASNKAGFCDASNALITGGSGTLTASATTSWRVAKYAADSVVLYGNGLRVAKLAYSALPAAPAATPTPFFFFGNRALDSNPTPTAVTSLWTQVSYEIGATSP